jgi:hypothetical protein
MSDDYSPTRHGGIPFVSNHTEQVKRFSGNFCGWPRPVDTPTGAPASAEQAFQVGLQNVRDCVGDLEYMSSTLTDTRELQLKIDGLCEEAQAMLTAVKRAVRDEIIDPEERCDLCGAGTVDNRTLEDRTREPKCPKCGR